MASIWTFGSVPNTTFFIFLIDCRMLIAHVLSQPASRNGGLGLGGLVNSVDESAEVLDMLETSERCWGTWENALAW